MSEKFTNRRGKTTSVETDDSLREVGPAHYEVKVPEARAGQPRNILWKPIIVSLAIALVAVIVVLEVTAAVYRGSTTSAQARVKSIVTTDVVTLQQKSDIKSADLDNLVKKYDSVAKELCPGAMLDNLAKLYPRAASALADCTAYRSKVEALSGSLGGLRSQAAYLERLPSILSPATQPLADQFAVLGSQQENWQNITEGLKGLTPPEQFRSAHEALVKAAGDIMSGWTLAVSATNNRSGADLAKAQNNLREAYGSFRAQADSFQTTLNAAQDQVLKVANDLELSNI